ncbi:SusE domain-containing protein [Flavobacteriaceae bacterium S356]|uniref:SusE domain-containing protein n=1 Tax=Asprobacillus argus TaxID=3076534 RepID=A0ABU3LCW9_9FLAO|nr:SusE domain-containing protein [Flavobacteriaceae bacterium S356]
MKRYIKKLSYLLLTLTLLMGACQPEETLIITPPNAEFTLDAPGISNVYLNFALPNNPAFTITWKDDITGSSDYTVEMSTDDAFTSPVTLGTSTTDNFSMTVSDFNDAIVSTGVTNFSDIAVYMRVNGGGTYTNSILFLVTSYPVNAPTFGAGGAANGDSFSLSLANNDQIAITIAWEDPILASNLVDVDYYVEGAAPSTNFITPIEAAMVTNQTSVTLTNAELNALAIESGIAVDATGDLEIRVRSVITDAASGSVLERISTSITISVTTYLTVLDLSTTWGVVGSAANNWGATPDLPFYKTDVDGVIAAYVTLTDGEIKFRENNDWANNYGSNSSTGGALVAGGGNLTVSAGAYKIVMDLNNLTYTIESFSLGIVGSSYNNWGATPDFMLEYDPYSDVFRGIATLLTGEMKFRMNNDWTVNYGDNGNDGTLDAGGANIVTTAGIYIVTVNMNDMTYTLEPIDYVWGLVGSAYNNWGATPDAQFTRDWSQPFGDVWILRDVDLLAGEYKFRANNDWAVNYGDNGSNGTLEAGGANIVSTAGTYTITLDFTDPANPTYTVN